jgi:hypothetical protein
MADLPDPASAIPASPEFLFDEAARFTDRLVRIFPTKPDALEAKCQ